MSDNMQYEIESYKTVLWWALVSVTVWPKGHVAAQYWKDAESLPKVTEYLFFKSRSPEFVQEYIRQDMKRINTKARRRKILEQSYLTHKKES